MPTPIHRHFIQGGGQETFEVPPFDRKVSLEAYGLLVLICSLANEKGVRFCGEDNVEVGLTRGAILDALRPNRHNPSYSNPAYIQPLIEELVDAEYISYPDGIYEKL